jgi:hypothetical protein
MSYVRGIEGKRSTEVTEPGNITKPLTPARKLPQSGSEKQGGCLALSVIPQGRRKEDRIISKYRERRKHVDELEKDLPGTDIRAHISHP